MYYPSSFSVAVTKYHRLGNSERLKVYLNHDSEGQGFQDRVASSGETLLTGRGLCRVPRQYKVSQGESEHHGSGLSSLYLKPLVKSRGLQPHDVIYF